MKQRGQGRLKGHRKSSKMGNSSSRGNSKCKSWGGFAGGPLVKNPPANAWDTGSVSGPGTKIPHATGQLSLQTTTTEPDSLGPVLHKRSHRHEKPAHRKKEQPRLTAT